ncbi:ionotropic receptor 75a isoform X3 [Bactrocera dorsalis]|uniref:Ionotropic receptor 75a isoform X3 n=1 Tax=Bactrocera dorsalis TaxID=27457 RepID=A0ABM3KAH4_BACDO|nr:ionotropic receptor 75a isoform X3 [Bactrocera dorsalis]
MHDTIDVNDVISNIKIFSLLSDPGKQSGISAFTKYYYELVQILKDHINFRIEFRVARGWAGKLANTSYRLGFLGIMARNEADVGASGIFNRLNRFSDFDIIHQGWKFETAFIYRAYASELSFQIKGDNFLIPLKRDVWLAIIWLFAVISLVYWLLSNVNLKLQLKNNKQLLDARCLQHVQTELTQEEHKRTFGEYTNDYYSSDLRDTLPVSNIFLIIIAAICQQSIISLSRSSAIRILYFVIFINTLLIYNYYTSSVVSGLLSSSLQGPANIDEIITSSLKVSFEDIGYYKVLFKESNSPVVARLIHKKLLSSRKYYDLPVFTNIKTALPFIKDGSYAFHCEVVDAFAEIAKNFEAKELCSLRVIKGLMEMELMNGIVHKNSQYTEIFRFTMHWAREIGLVGRILNNRQPKRLICQSVYFVFPVNLSNMPGLYFILLGTILSLLTSLFEIVYHFYSIQK